MQNRVYGLLLFPVVFAILALCYNDFAFKAGVAGSGILILSFLIFGSPRAPKAVWMIPVAFLFSIAGDWLLSNRHGDTGMFIAGICLYFCAHLCFLIFALRNGKPNIPVMIVLLAVYVVFFSGWLVPAIRNTLLLLSVGVYTVISCLSFSAAAGIRTLSTPGKTGFVAGIFLIVFSDTLISFGEFLSVHTLDDLILPSYYLAHICITFAIMVILFYKEKYGNNHQ